MTEIKASQKEWLGLVVLALTCMLYSMDLTVLNLAVPRLSQDLQPTPSQLLWIVDVYGFFLAGSLITMGTLGDRIGRRKLLLIGGGLFGLVSAIAAFSNSPEMLIFLRALQGMAGATLAPSTLSLIRVLFKNPKQRSVAIGIWGTSFSIGGLIGPLVGGFLIENFWWGSVFLINVPIMLVMILLGPILLPEYKNPDSGKLDLLSAGLSLAGVLLIVLGLKLIAEHGLQIAPFLYLGLGLFLAWFFFRRQKSLKDPFVSIQLFAQAQFNALMTTNFLTMFVVFGTFIFTSQYMQLIMGLSPIRAGLWSMTFSAGFIISSLLSPWIVRWTRPAYVMAAGLMLGALGFILVSQVKGAEDILMMGIGTFLFSLGSSPVLLFTTGMLVNSAPPEKAGAAAALSETSNELGGALGIAILGSLGTFLYGRKLAQAALEFERASPEMTINGTLESTLRAVEKLPLEIAAPLKTLVHTAYIESFEMVMLVSSLILFFLAGLVVSRLKHAKLEDEA